MGIHQACPEAEIVGVDIKPQPRYPFTFVQADAMTFPLEGFDFVWASPPCQGYTLMRHMGKRAGEGAPKLIEPVRSKLIESGATFVIENVVGSPLYRPVTLCGSMFQLGVRRHRLFESSFPIVRLKCNHDRWPIAVWGDDIPSRQEVRRQHRGPIAVYGDHPEDSAIHGAKNNKPGLTRRAATLKVGQEAMEIDWMEWKELTQAIPPAYSRYIFEQWLAQKEVLSENPVGGADTSNPSVGGSQADARGVQAGQPASHHSAVSQGPGEAGGKGV